MFKELGEKINKYLSISKFQNGYFELLIIIVNVYTEVVNVYRKVFIKILKIEDICLSFCQKITSV